MTIKTCKFRIGDVYLFHATDPGCESGTSLWGIVNDRDTDGRICLETSSYGQTNEKYKENSRKSSTADREPTTYSRASNFGSQNEM